MLTFSVLKPLALAIFVEICPYRLGYFGFSVRDSCYTLLLYFASETHRYLVGYVSLSARINSCYAQSSQFGLIDLKAEMLEIALLALTPTFCHQNPEL